MTSLPPHYVAFRVTLALALCALTVLAALWFVGAFPAMVIGLGG